MLKNVTYLAIQALSDQLLLNVAMVAFMSYKHAHVLEFLQWFGYFPFLLKVHGIAFVGLKADVLLYAEEVF